MITVSNLGMQFGGQWLFQHVDLQFLPGNCYGIIGANGAGKSTFLRILTGELDSTTGSISIDPTKRVSVLKQNQNAYDEYTVLDTVIMGNQHLYDVMKEKDAIYEKPDFSDEDGLRAADLEAEFAELGGWEAESDASRLLQGLGIGTELHYDQMADTDPRLKVKVLLAQALFGESLIPPFVLRRPGFLKMLGTVQLNSQLGLIAVKINDIRPQCLLPVHRNIQMLQEVVPQVTLFLGHLLAQLLCIGGQLGIACVRHPVTFHRKKQLLGFSLIRHGLRRATFPQGKAFYILIQRNHNTEL